MIITTVNGYEKWALNAQERRKLEVFKMMSGDLETQQLESDAVMS